MGGPIVRRAIRSKNSALTFTIFMQSKVLSVGVTCALVVCALITTGLVVKRELFTSASVAMERTVAVRGWKEDVAKGHLVGGPQRSVQIMEFADFECPYCGEFHNTLKKIESKYPDQIGLSYLHFPIEGHRFALPAARAAECAADQGRFGTMHDQLFEGQDQFGLKPWNDYAMAAGVPDIAAFDACIKKTHPIPRVEEGKALGAKLDVHGTPTVIINGWKLGHPPNEQELDEMVKKILAGKSPVDGKS
jgi:protein-disulfide isomerase